MTAPTTSPTAQTAARRAAPPAAAPTFAQSVWLVAEREIGSKLRSKAFLISFGILFLIALALGLKLGDRLLFDIGGVQNEARITSLRKVDWESFKPNFFVLVSPGVLQDYAASHITAVRVPPDHPRFTAQLVQAFPNLSVIDVDAVLQQVRATGDLAERAGERSTSQIGDAIAARV